MRFGIVSARYFLDNLKTWQVYGEKLKSVVHTSFYTDIERNCNPVIEIEVETIEQLKSVAKSVGYDLFFPRRDNDDIWIKDDYME